MSLSWLFLREADDDCPGHYSGWWKEEHFNATDADGDDFLNVTEFYKYISTCMQHSL